MDEKEIRDFLLDNQDYLEGLAKIIEYEEENDKDNHFTDKAGSRSEWEYSDVGMHPSRINKLVTEGIVDKIYSSQSSTKYALNDFEEAKKAYAKLPSPDESGNVVEEVDHDFPDKGDLPEKLFDEVLGYDDVKWLFKRGLTTDEITNFLMVGPPGSAKTVFLLSIRDHLEDASFVTARSTSAGFVDKMFEQKPKYMLIDELDDTPEETQEALSSYTETGILSETKHDKDREMKINTKTLASANNISDVQGHIENRFTTLHFEPYSKDEYIEVCEHVLPMKEGTDTEESRDIARAVWDLRGEGDVRQAIQVARLSEGDPERVVSVLKKYSGGKSGLDGLIG